MAAKERDNLTSMDDIARLAKVAKSTVSRALKDSPLLNPGTKRRILAIARRHGYAVNANAQKLRTNRTSTIAVVMHLPTSSASAAAPFFFELLNDVARGLWIRHYDLLLCSPEAEDAYHYETMISSKRADGIIFLGQGPGDKWLRDLARTRVPFVVWGAAETQSSYCTVGSDNRKGGMLSGQRFAELGRKRILFVGNRAHPEMDLRRQGLAAAMEKAAGDAYKIDDLEIPDFTFETGYSAMRGYLAQRTLPPDAVFAGSDSVAMGVVVAAREAKLRVPADISVVGYNDLPIARHFQLPLTTVRQDTHQAGSLLVEKLFQLLSGTRPRSAKVPTELIVRDT